MNTEHKLLGYYNYTVILTYIGMLSGFLGIICAVRELFYPSIVCLMFSGFCDMFDGAIASTRERNTQEKCFGIQIDSLSDLVCFGVLPAMIVCSMNKGLLIVCIGALYVLCALIRLSYFNVDEQERQQKSSEPRSLYYGLPVTLSALFVPMIFSIFSLLSWRTDLALTVTIILMGIFFLVPVPLKKPKLAGKIGFICCGIAAFILVMLVRTRL